MEDNIKRIEIVTDMAYLKRLLVLFDEKEIHGYTIIKDITGKGKRGNKDGHGMSAGFKNVYIFIFAEEDEARTIAEIVKPYLTTFGGMCAVSDAHWVVH
jgi:hypothetical protein